MIELISGKITSLIMAIIEDESVQVVWILFLILLVVVLLLHLGNFLLRLEKGHLQGYVLSRVLSVPAGLRGPTELRSSSWLRLRGVLHHLASKTFGHELLRILAVRNVSV